MTTMFFSLLDWVFFKDLPIEKSQCNPPFIDNPLNKVSTHPVVRPHVLLSNPKEVLQWSLPTCSETDSDELHRKYEVTQSQCTNSNCAVSLSFLETLFSLSTWQSTQSWLELVLVYQEMMTDGLIHLHGNCLPCHLAPQCFPQDNLLNYISVLCLWSYHPLIANRKWTEPNCSEIN